MVLLLSYEQMNPDQCLSASLLKPSYSNQSWIACIGNLRQSLLHPQKIRIRFGALRGSDSSLRALQGLRIPLEKLPSERQGMVASYSLILIATVNLSWLGFSAAHLKMMTSFWKALSPLMSLILALSLQSQVHSEQSPLSVLFLR